MLQLIAYVKSLGSEERRTGNEYGHCRSPRSSGRIRRELSKRDLRHQVVASDAGPQADRTALSRLDHADVLRGRSGGRSDAPASDRAAGRALRTGNLQQDVFDSRDHHGLLLPGPVDSGDAWKFPDSSDDRGARRRLSQAESDELVHLHHRRGVCSLRHAFGRRGHRLDLLSALQQRVLADSRCGRGAGGFHRRFFLDPHGPELHRHDPQDAGAGHDLVPSAARSSGRCTPRASSLCLARP